MDFHNPTEEQIRDAQKHGVDLRDPVVVAQLEHRAVFMTGAAWLV